jgi:hypothetical protein
MRHLIKPLIIYAALAVAACNPGATSENTSAPANTSSTNANAPTTTTQPAGGVPPISSAHGGVPAAPAAPANPNEKPEGVDTAALDDKIDKLEAKVKAGSATAADKKALADVYLERANTYRDAGSPRLYKFALGDYRRVLRYDPTNAEAKAKMDEIISIYNSMGRPVPTNGLEQ